MNRRRSWQEYIRDHLPLYVFVSVLFLTGVVFGAMLVGALTLEQKQELGRYLDSYLHTMHHGVDDQGSYFFRESLLIHARWLLLIGVLGMTIIGMPFVLALDFLKGVLVGFTVGYMVGEMSWRGMLFAFVSVVPHNVLLIPVILIASVTSLSFSLLMIRQRFNRQWVRLSPAIGAYALTMLALLFTLPLISLVEAFLVPVLMEWSSSGLISAWPAWSESPH